MWKTSRLGKISGSRSERARSSSSGKVRSGELAALTGDGKGLRVVSGAG